MSIKYHLIGSLGGGLFGACIGFLLKGNAGIAFGAFYGVIIGGIVGVSMSIRNKKK